MVGRALGLALLAAAVAVPAGAAQKPARWPTDRAVPFLFGGGTARAKELVRRALRTWSDATSGVLRFEESGQAEERGIRVSFTGEHPYFGLASPLVDGGSGEILLANVLIGADPAGSDALQKDLVVYLTALHELGHAIGLEHSDRWGEIMYAFRNPNDPDRVFLRYRRKLRSEADIGSPEATGLSGADLRRVRARYPLPE